MLCVSVSVSCQLFVVVFIFRLAASSLAGLPERHLLACIPRKGFLLRSPRATIRSSSHTPLAALEHNTKSELGRAKRRVIPERIHRRRSFHLSLRGRFATTLRRAARSRTPAPPSPPRTQKLRSSSVRVWAPINAVIGPPSASPCTSTHLSAGFSHVDRAFVCGRDNQTNQGALSTHYFALAVVFSAPINMPPAPPPPKKTAKNIRSSSEPSQHTK